MRAWLLDYLRCPLTGGVLRPEEVRWRGDRINSGRLVCDHGPTAYPIIRGIPRLIPGLRSEVDLRRVYADSFGHQWNTFDWPRARDEQEYFSISDQTPQSLDGLTVLDAGCGGGRLSRVIGRHCRRLIGLDYSVAVERAACHTGDLDNCEFVQGDILRPPLAREAFDYVWSHGVLHHTPDARAGFGQLARLVRPTGRLHVIVFLKAWLPLRLSDSLVRTWMRRLPYRVATRICRAMGALRHVPAASFWKRFFWFSLQPTAELRTCCNFDWYTPRYHHEHTFEQVAGWFRDAGFEDVRYINGWPDAPPREKFTPPGFSRRSRLGQLLGVVGRRPPAGATLAPQADRAHPSADTRQVAVLAPR